MKTVITFIILVAMILETILTLCSFGLYIIMCDEPYKLTFKLINELDEKESINSDIQFNSKQPAFPIFLQEGLTHNCHTDAGLTKREYFAALAMQGLLSCDAKYGNKVNTSKLIEDSIKHADELLIQLK